VAYAASHHMAPLTYPAPKSGAFPGLSPSELVQQLVQEHKADYVLLAGYLRVSGAAGAGLHGSTRHGSAGSPSQCMAVQAPQGAWWGLGAGGAAHAAGAGHVCCVLRWHML
jgi:hypothetical protein